MLYYDLTSEDKKKLGVEIELTRKEFEEIEPIFREYAKQRTTKLLIQTNYPEYPYYMSGSASYFFYRNKHFLLTCEHCVKDVAPIDRTSLVKALCNTDNGMTVARINSHRRDVEMDLAVFELESDYCNSNNFVGHAFVVEKQIKKDYINYLENQNNVILLCGSSSDESSGIDFDTGKGIISNGVIITFYNNYNYEYDLLNINISNIGFTIEGGYREINEVKGLSGSWIYCYQRGDRIPFKGIGMIVRGSRDSGNMWALGIDKITSFIDSQYFNQP
ncbi:serine protease [Paenibacillus sp. WQ 127069]|uniref:Serine protease n=1 Tax=Paenibacillus baimaensis TaxID=2982185 RepID=A0ABT2UGP6_9BACL|nr:serine protease [Paenibacillus sp. WQ 127069]MCU6793311.1 serine protease [Paenibacillus sp. WQ 127069]